MKIGLRVFYNAGWMGGINYVLNIARMLNNLPEHERPDITFLTSTPESEIIANNNRNLVSRIEKFSNARALNLDFVYPATQLPEAPFGAPWGGWIPDWQCQHLPEMFEKQELARRFLHYRELARRPSVCLFSSFQAIEDTRILFPDFDDSGWSVFNFPAVFDSSFWDKHNSTAHEKLRERMNIPENYFIICNQFWKHKNHLVVAEALSLAPDLDIHIVMTGAIEDSRWPKYAKQVQKLLAIPNVASKVTLTNRISRDEQLMLLRGATGYIQPSLFEGWSTFIEEARALGLPGLISDIPVHREQSPPDSTFFDPRNANDLVQKMKNISTNLPRRTSLTDAKNRHAEYTQNCARVFLNIARKSQKMYDPQKHELVAVLEQTIPELFEHIAENNRYEQRDLDRWLAAIRLSLRDHPEDLARLGARLCQDNHKFSENAKKLIVIATLAKCSPEIRQRFLDFDLESDIEAQGIRKLQGEMSTYDVQTQLAIKSTLFRLRDLVRRKLPT